MSDFGTVSGLTQEIRVNRLEHRLDPAVPFPHRHSFYHLVVVSAGSGWHEIDFQRYKVRSREVFFMKPGQVHSWKMGRETRGYVVEFEGESLFDTAVAERILPTLPSQLRAESKNTWTHLHSLLTLMLEDYVNLPGFYDKSLIHYLSALMIMLSRLEKTGAERQESLDPFTERFLQLVEKEFRRQHRVQFYADAMRTTPKALTMRVSRSLGTSARAVVQERCLLESKRLLAYSDQTITQIGDMLGFEDPNYFSRFFRDNAGISPRSFRDRARSLS